MKQLRSSHPESVAFYSGDVTLAYDGADSWVKSGRKRRDDRGRWSSIAHHHLAKPVLP